jgi:hypothetical protein
VVVCVLCSSHVATTQIHPGSNTAENAERGQRHSSYISVGYQLSLRFQTPSIPPSAKWHKKQCRYKAVRASPGVLLGSLRKARKEELRCEVDDQANAGLLACHPARSRSGVSVPGRFRLDQSQFLSSVRLDPVNPLSTGPSCPVLSSLRPPFDLPNCRVPLSLQLYAMYPPTCVPSHSQASKKCPQRTSCRKSRSQWPKQSNPAVATSYRDTLRN